MCFSKKIFVNSTKLIISYGHPFSVVVEANFEALKAQGELTKEKMEQFVKDNFLAAGQELEMWSPEDWVDNPKILDRIKDLNYRQFAKGLNDLWKILGRKIKPKVAENPKRFSLIDVPYPFIIPGDRFREFYYWDTYWIIKGLLLSDMVSMLLIYSMAFFCRVK